jgi:hypothetical protein
MFYIIYDQHFKKVKNLNFFNNMEKFDIVEIFIFRNEHGQVNTALESKAAFVHLHRQFA